MSRPIDQTRPGELRERVVRYLAEHGLAGLSLRPLAKAVGCSPRVLLYHFGSKEKLVTEALAEARRQQRTAFAEIRWTGFAETYGAVWERMTAPESEPLFRLFFETYGVALAHPEAYQDFLRQTIEDWLPAIEGDFSESGIPVEDPRAFATMVLAGLRGFMLDFCTTHDRERLDRAVRLWLGGLERMLHSEREEP